MADARASIWSRREFMAVPAFAVGAALTGFAQTGSLTAGQIPAGDPFWRP